jgi:hypothetical protein
MFASAGFIGRNFAGVSGFLRIARLYASRWHSIPVRNHSERFMRAERIPAARLGTEGGEKAAFKPLVNHGLQIPHNDSASHNLTRCLRDAFGFQFLPASSEPRTFLGSTLTILSRPED